MLKTLTQERFDTYKLYITSLKPLTLRIHDIRRPLSPAEDATPLNIEMGLFVEPNEFITRPVTMYP
jgi:hypothetical protein